MPRKSKSQEQFIAEARAAHGSKYDYTKTVFIDSNHNVIITCPIHGDFEQNPYNHLKGHGCRKCKGDMSKDKSIKDNDTNGLARTRAYKCWNRIFERCYSKIALARAPFYEGCSVCEEWHCFSAFKEWFDENYIEGYALDKDILVKRNKIYGPDTCCFVPREINSIMVNRRNHRGQYPIGVKPFKDKFIARCPMQMKRTYLGLYNTPEAAFNAYKEAKENNFKELAEKYYKEGKITERVYNALLNYRVEITD